MSDWIKLPLCLGHRLADLVVPLQGLADARMNGLLGVEELCGAMSSGDPDAVERRLQRVLQHHRPDLAGAALVGVYTGGGLTVRFTVTHPSLPRVPDGGRIPSQDLLAPPADRQVTRDEWLGLDASVLREKRAKLRSWMAWTGVTARTGPVPPELSPAASEAVKGMDVTTLQWDEPAKGGAVKVVVTPGAAARVGGTELDAVNDEIARLEATPARSLAQSCRLMELVGRRSLLEKGGGS